MVNILPFNPALQDAENILQAIPGSVKEDVKSMRVTGEMRGMGPYYRFHHGENKLSPKQQDDIMQILAHFGSTDGIKFDHYETEWNFE